MTSITRSTGRFALGFAFAAGLTAAGAVGLAAAAQSSDASPDRAAPTSGTVPDAAFSRDGSGLDMERVPELIAVSGQEGDTVGYLKKSDLYPTDGSQPLEILPVWDESGTELLGHTYPNGVGFMSLQQEADAGVGPENPPPDRVTPTTVIE